MKIEIKPNSTVIINLTGIDKLIIDKIDEVSNNQQLSIHTITFDKNKSEGVISARKIFETASYSEAIITNNNHLYHITIQYHTLSKDSIIVGEGKIEVL
jgi:hypothetical protein